jgi:hypothetical protein
MFCFIAIDCGSMPLAASLLASPKAFGSTTLYNCTAAPVISLECWIITLKTLLILIVSSREIMGSTD